MGVALYSLVILTLIYISPCNSARCPCQYPPPCDCTTARCKREIIDPFYYPHPGTWYQDSTSGKYYFSLGKTVFVQRSDGFYSKWVTSGDGADWSLNDNYLWRWDNNGRWFPLKEDDGDEFKDTCSKFQLPIKCMGTECPEQIRFPSNGVWYVTGGKTIYKDDTKENKRYELQDNGLYRKFKGDVQICPEYWTWNMTTGVWYHIEGSSGISACQTEVEDTTVITGPTGEREGLLKPPRKVFSY
ncbi:uncharacterized protein LOC123308266 isoform X2 [Coccinella septempunctata]|uniref:uncharacterized protein LOC123308266 isoform X2 n=1 Tax=Coccinella septempunctata TaxID=41139 RepID=UPI001D068CF2|nr:uncharacterized protein LOC123308266 isoform X2 [Coccinella septempunctata]